jgi:hypothetical protein
MQVRVISSLRFWVLALLGALSLSLSLPAAAQGKLSFESLERSLRLNAYQKLRFDAAVNATHRAAVAIGLGALQAKGRLAAELLKDRPDPNALALAQDELVKVARDFVDEKLKLVEQLGAHLGRYIAENLPRK